MTIMKIEGLYIFMPSTGDEYFWKTSKAPSLETVIEFLNKIENFENRFTDITEHYAKGMMKYVERKELRLETTISGLKYVEIDGSIGGGDFLRQIFI